MDLDDRQQAFLFSNIAAQLRGALSNLHLAAAQLVPASQREQDPELDARAALLDQSYYQLLRLVNNLSAAAQYLGSDAPLPPPGPGHGRHGPGSCASRPRGPRPCWDWSCGSSVLRNSISVPFISRHWSC